MYVADLFAHCVQEFMFVAFLWQVVNFDRIRLRRKPPNQPVSDHALKRIMRPDGGGDRSFVVSFPASSLPFFPDRRRRHSSFCLPPDVSAFVHCDRHEAALAETSHARLATHNFVGGSQG